MSNFQNLDDVKKKGVGFVNGVIIKSGIRQYEILRTSTGAFVSSTTVLADADRYDVDQNKSMRLWVLPAAENYAGGETITFKFYIYEEGVDALAKTVAVITPAVVAGEAGYIDLVDSDNCFEQYTHFTASGTFTVAAGGYLKSILLAQGNSAYTADNVIVVNPTAIEVKKENNTSGSTTDGTWIVLPENSTFVAIQVNALGAGTKANVEYTKDRAGAILNSVTCFENWDAGEINNKVQGASFDDIAGIRLNVVLGSPKMFWTAG